jgi:hypothetical protein
MGPSEEVKPTITETSKPQDMGRDPQVMNKLVLDKEHHKIGINNKCHHHKIDKKTEDISSLDINNINLDIDKPMITEIPKITETISPLSIRMLNSGKGWTDTNNTRIPIDKMGMLKHIGDIPKETPITLHLEITINRTIIMQPQIISKHKLEHSHKMVIRIQMTPTHQGVEGTLTHRGVEDALQEVGVTLQEAEDTHQEVEEILIQQETEIIDAMITDEMIEEKTIEDKIVQVAHQEEMIQIPTRDIQITAPQVATKDNQLVNIIDAIINTAGDHLHQDDKASQKPRNLRQ